MMTFSEAVRLRVGTSVTCDERELVGSVSTAQESAKHHNGVGVVAYRKCVPIHWQDPYFVPFLLFAESTHNSNMALSSCRGIS